MSFSINPSNSGKSTQETDRDMNNKKIAYLANPTDKEDAANKQCVDKTKNNQKQSIYLFLVKIYRRSLFIEALIKEKATCWYHIDHNSNNEVCYYNNVSVNCFQSIRIELPRNTKIIKFQSDQEYQLHHTREDNFSFAMKIGNFDLPFYNPCNFSVFSAIKMSKNGAMKYTQETA